MTESEKITFFAKTNFRSKEVPFGIKPDDRRRHVYVIGKTGMGKTTMMENMVIQDIHNGHGVAFIDPHGDSIVKILNHVPNHRINDVIYFNPADLDHPIAFNILESVEARYKHLVASGLMGVFTKIWANMWSARMEYILNNTILALLESPGNTMLGIVRMYVDKKYRKKIVDNVKDPMVRSFWTDEFANYAEKFRTEAVAPIQNKVGQFLSSAIIRNIVGQPKSTIDLRGVMDNRKILLMDLSKGKVGEDNSALLGAMVITKLQLAALSRVDIPESERQDFYLYVDEFQNFVTDSFATILSEARKYRLDLTIGHQYVGQLVPEKGNTKVRDAVFGNVGTIVSFRVGAEDAELLEKEFTPIFTATDIVNLPKYHVILKLMINGVASDPFSAVTLAPNESLRTDNADKIIKVSRERYANPVLDVEDKISRWMGAEFHEQTALVIGQEEKPAVEDEPQALPPTPTQTITAPAPELMAASPAEVAPAPQPVVYERRQGERRQAISPQRQGHKPSFAGRPAQQYSRPQTNQPHNLSHRQHRPKPRHGGARPQKYEDPIWNTVRELDKKKSETETQPAGPAASQRPVSAQPNPPPQPKPSVPDKPETDSTVIAQPGQVYKF